MSARARDVELLLLTAFAAVPLYFTAAVGIVPLALFHAAFAVMTIRVARGGRAAFVPLPVMRSLAVAFVPLYIVDAMRSGAIAASTHLVLFIAVYQPMDVGERDNRAQRLLTTALIFVASLATSTHISVALFVIAFALVMFRQMMYLSHLETERSTGRTYADLPSSRAAVFYLAGTVVLAALLFPFIPRIRNPMIQGVTGSLTNATSGLSNAIDFNKQRSSMPDPSVVARVWMGQEAIPFFTPLRLRGTVYDRYDRNRWLQTQRGFTPIDIRNGSFRIARPIGFTRGARVLQRLSRSNPRVFVPTGTYAVTGLTVLAEGPGRGAYATSPGTRDVITYEVSMARRTAPLRAEKPRLISYPVIPEVAALATRIAGNATDPAEKAAAVERYLLRNFRYVVNPEQIGHTMTTDDFLLRERRGHCEYFAAGMVALMTALDVPARIVGGFYGGRLNPLTGYFVVRSQDAHAWVEVWDGEKWLTFDPTPPSLRPGNTQDGLLRTYATAVSDSVNYYWDRYVLTYGLGDQIAFASALISSAMEAMRALRPAAPGAPSRQWWLRMAVVAGALVALSFAIAMVAKRRRSLFAELADHLERLGIRVGPSMTMEEALAMLRAQQPEAARELEPLIALYEAERFSAAREPGRVRAIRRRLRELRA